MNDDRTPPSPTVKDFDPSERPREKADRYGYHTLTKAELLALILRTGLPGHPITEITRDLLDANSGSLHLLMRRSVKEIQQSPGMGPVKAGQVKAIMELVKRYYEEEREASEAADIMKCSSDIYNYMRFEIGNLNKEEIWILTLNRRNRVIGRYRLTRGSAVSSVFDLNAALKTAILDEATGLVMLHNHPSGNLRPSAQDDAITRAMKTGASAIGVLMVDHLIISREGYYSYSDEGRL